MKVLISLEERQLVLNSEIIKNYSALKIILTKYERVYESDFHDTWDFNPELKTFIHYSFKKVVDEASKEWFASYHESEVIHADIKQWKHCSLCNAPNKYIFYIKNRMNGIELNVGSECITKFPLINELSGKSVDVIKRDRIKEYNRIDRINKFNKVYPGIEEMKKEWRVEYNRLPIVMPIAIHERAEIVFKNADTVYSDYINGKTDDDAIKNFQIIIDNYLSLSEDIKVQINNMQNEKFVCTIKIKDWLINNKLNNVLEQIIKDGGILTKSSIQKVYYPDFINTQMAGINSIISETPLKVVNIRENKLNFKFIDSSKDTFYFECLLKTLMETYGANLINLNAKVDLGSLISTISVTWNEKNIAAIINKFNSAIDKTSYKMSLKFPENEVEITDFKEKRFAIVKASAFINAQKSLLFKENNNKYNTLQALFDYQISSWKSLDEKSKYDIGDISRKPNSSSKRDFDDIEKNTNDEVAASNVSSSTSELVQEQEAIDIKPKKIDGFYLISNIVDACPYDKSPLKLQDIEMAVYADKKKKHFDSFVPCEILYCGKCQNNYLNQSLLDKILEKIGRKKIKRLKFGNMIQD